MTVESMTGLFPISLDEMIAAADREIAMRQRVYPRWVAEGRMKQAKADHEIAAMRAIATTLKSLRENPCSNSH